jgi:2-phosphosulfolactate phosphatase
MPGSVIIDYLAESVQRYRSGWAIVVVDVIRATTTAVTAAAAGRRCITAPTVEVALALAAGVNDPLLAGEASGAMPASFELDNSPAQIAERSDTHRPLVLVSSSGTRVIHEAAGCPAVYLSCFRNHSALATHLVGRYERVAVIGAGSKGEFREEDQICCAWIAATLMQYGYAPASAQTSDVVKCWGDSPASACLCSNSVDFLKRTGRLRDLDFILGHVDDLFAVFQVQNGEVKTVPARARTHHRKRWHRSCA